MTPSFQPAPPVTRAPKITVNIPGPLRDCCAGAAELSFPATNLRAVLEELERRHPALHRNICDETGALRRHINLFVNIHHMRDRDGLETQFVEGDVVTMHTILRDGNRVHLGISTGGHYLSEDGGETFAAANQGVGAGFTPDPFPEFGQCVHKIAGHKNAPGRLYMQNHGGWAEWDGPGGRRPDIGVLRSDDHGHTWRSIAKGLPLDFGFPIVVHPHNPDILYVVPLEPMTRTCPGGVPAVWRSENGGGSWKKLAQGLPKKDSFFTVLRDGLDIDEFSSPALYFGTTTGQLWMGRDGGEKWECLFDALPPIHCVKAAVA